MFYNSLKNYSILTKLNNLSALNDLRTTPKVFQAS